MRYLLVFVALLPLAGGEFPEASISNGKIQARLHLPDAVHGSYHGTRFDWSGIIYSLEYKGHQFVDRWYDRHDPRIHDAITGPVEEFKTGDSALGYAEAKAGGTFLRIGVGVVRKPEGEESYQPFRTYEIVDPGKWEVDSAKDRITFTHRVQAPGGYAYEYVKTVRLARGKPVMRIEHQLRNTGARPIETNQYNHNFFVIDHQTVGPDVVIRFGFNAQSRRDLKGMAEIRDRELNYARELAKGESAYTEVDGAGPTGQDYRFEIENRKSGAGVRIRGDRPLSKVVFWSIRTVACPEPYIDLKIEPGKTERWTVEYEFYAR